jgi:hypothetical protein
MLLIKFLIATLYGQSNLAGFDLTTHWTQILRRRRRQYHYNIDHAALGVNNSFVRRNLIGGEGPIRMTNLPHRLGLWRSIEVLLNLWLNDVAIRD